MSGFAENLVSVQARTLTRFWDTRPALQFPSPVLLPFPHPVHPLPPRAWTLRALEWGALSTPIAFLFLEMYTQCNSAVLKTCKNTQK